MRSQEFTDKLNGDRAEYVWRRLVGVNDELPVPCGEGEVITHIAQTAAAKPVLNIADGRIVPSEGVRLLAIHDVAGRRCATSGKLPAGIYIVTLMSAESKTPLTVKVMIKIK